MTIYIVQNIFIPTTPLIKTEITDSIISCVALTGISYCVTLSHFALQLFQAHFKYGLTPELHRMKSGGQ